MASLVEQLRLAADDPMWADHAEVPKAWLRRSIDHITELEAMCETLAGALGPFAEHLFDPLGIVKPDLPREQFRAARQALTQYRAMKEKNDG